MANQVLLALNSPATMSSREIAELTKKRHDNVIRDIRNMLAQIYDGVADDFLPEKFLENQLPSDLRAGISVSEYGTNNAKQPVYEYLLDKAHTLTLITGYDAKRRHAINKRWLELEEAAHQPVPQVPPMPGTLHPEDIAEELAKFLADKDQVTNADLLEALWPGEPWQQDRASILGKIMKKHFRNWFRRRVGYPQARAWCYVRSRKGERPALPAPQPTDMPALPAPDDRLFTDLDFRIAAGEALNQYMQACWDAGRAGTPAPPPSGEALLMIANGLYGRALNRRQFLVTFRQPFELRPLPLTAAVVDPASRGDIEALVGKRVPIGLIPEIVAQCMARLMLPQG